MSSSGFDGYVSSSSVTSSAAGSSQAVPTEDGAATMAARLMDSRSSGQAYSLGSRCRTCGPLHMPGYFTLRVYPGGKRRVEGGGGGEGIEHDALPEVTVKLGGVRCWQSLDNDLGVANHPELLLLHKI